MKFTDEKIQAMAFSAGLDSAMSTADAVLVWEGEAKLIRALVELAAKAEREECEKLAAERAARSEASMLKAKGMKTRDIHSAAAQAAHWIKNAIRARTTP